MLVARRMYERHASEPDSRPPPVSFSPPNAPPISAPEVPMLTLAMPQSLPEADRIPLQIGESPTGTMVVPLYPVIQYGHDRGGGDSIGSGFVYNGKLIPALRGKYVFTDLTTGRIWYADYKDMLAADDGKPGTLARLQPVRLLWNDPQDSPDAGKKVYDSMFPIVEAAYHARGGKHPKLPGRPELVFGGRADVRFSIDAGGELFLYSKSDGVIRAVVEAIGF